MVISLAGCAVWANSRGLIGPDFGRTVAAARAGLKPLDLHFAPEEQWRLVWRGADVDGDGQPDFANPTGKAPRTVDAYGSGAFDASRDGGERRHEGVDYADTENQPIKAPISGYVSKIGYAYPDCVTLRYIEIVNPALHFMARVFYVDPIVVEGQAVRLGQQIGVAHSLQDRYPGITNHVHLELARLGGPNIDATRLIIAKLEPPKSLARAAADAGARG